MQGVFAHRDFRLLLFGQAASTLGDRIVFVALALYVTDIGSPSDVGIVLAAHALPLVGFLLIGGVWADRLPRHRVMIVTDLVRFALHALLAVLIFTGSVEIWAIAVIEAAFGTAEAFFRPAYTGLIPQTVPERDIQQAKAHVSTIETAAEFAGPALATVLVLGVGAGWAFAIDAATFLVSAAFLLPLRPRERGEMVVRTTVLTELREGWAEVRSRNWIWVIDRRVLVRAADVVRAVADARRDGVDRGVRHAGDVRRRGVGDGRRARSWARSSASAGGRGTRCGPACCSRCRGPRRSPSSRSGSRWSRCSRSSP